jgi:hypothetical protein
MKNLILIALVLVSSACSSVYAGGGVFPPGIPRIGPVFPQPPHPGIGHVASSACGGDHQEFCIEDIHHTRTRTGEAYAFACPVRGTPEIGLGMVPVPIAGKDGHPGKVLQCEELPFATEIGFKGVKNNQTVAIAYVLLDEESGQYQVDGTCSYTMHGTRRAIATVGGRCSHD